MATLDQGHLIIRDLSPVKAKRIVEQLQFLDVQRDIEDKITLLEEEVEHKQKEKMTVSSAARAEESMERIIAIHTELISHRRDLEIELSHIREDHPKEGRVANLIVGVKARMAKGKVRRELDPLTLRMNKLFKKVQRKYATFMQYGEEEVSEEILRANELVKKQRGARKDREASGYIKAKGRVKLSR